MLWIVSGLFLLIAVAIGYVVYVRAREGQQPGEAFIEALLARITRERVDKAPPAAPIEPQQAQPPAAGVDWAAALPPLRARPDVPSYAPVPSTPLHPIGGRAMPQSNAHLFDPMPPDFSPGGFPLKYPVGTDPNTGRKVPAGAPVLMIDDAGNTAKDDAEALDNLARRGPRSEGLRREAERQAALVHSGPLPVPNPITQEAIGDAAYVVGQVTQYKHATGRDLFRDLYSGTDAQIVALWRDGDANRNQGMPYDPQLQGVIDSLVQRYRR